MQVKKLKNTLYANAAFSITSGLSMLLFSSQIANYMNIGEPRILLFIGGGLLLFALSLIRTARQSDIIAKKIKIIIWQDWLWVVGSVVIILFQAFSLNMAGYVIIGIVALIIADFALLQQWFLKKI